MNISSVEISRPILPLKKKGEDTPETSVNPYAKSISHPTEDRHTAAAANLQKAMIRFGSTHVADNEETILELASKFSQKPIKELLADAVQWKRILKSPAVTFHHLLIAALAQAEKELPNKDTMALPTTMGVIYSMTIDSDNPPVVDSIIDKNLYRGSVSAEEVQDLKDYLYKASQVQSLGLLPPDPAVDQLMQLKRSGKDINKLLDPKKLQKSGSLSPAVIRDSLSAFQKYLGNSVYKELNLSSPGIIGKESAYLEGFLKELVKDPNGNVSVGEIVKSIIDMPVEKLDDAPPSLKKMKQVLQDLRKEIEAVAGNNSTVKDMLIKLDKAFIEGSMPTETRREIRKEISRLEKPSNPMGISVEKENIETWLRRALSLPWNKTPDSKIDLRVAQNILDREHYGLEDVKQQVIDYLAARKQNPNARAKLLCFVGPPGTGKTSISRCIAEALGRNFVRMSVDGVTDEHEIKGHRRTYVGAIPGRIIESMEKAGSMNPVMVIDEVDKIGGAGDPKTQAAKSALLSVLDPEQNKDFKDHYFGFSYPLDDVFFILTANYEDQIPPALKDRVDVIRLSRYTDDEKQEIAQRHLLPKVMKDKGLNKDQYELTPDALKKIIQQYTREAGVRNLERVIGKTANRVTTIRQMSEDPSNYGKITVTPELLEDKSYLGKPIFGKPETISGKIPGQVNGLAWTEYGGDTIITKVNAIPTNSGWNGNLVSHISATGNLQDIMKESVQYVSGYIRKHHTKFQIADEYKNGVELNIHFPAAAVPKDGPSAGVTIGTAIVSALTGIPVRSDVAMTGELDIDGKVRPIGGLREKVDAAFRAGVKKVIIPAENAKDIEQIPEAQREAIEIVPVEWFDEVLPHALSQSPLVKDAPVKKTFQIGFAPHAKKAE